MLKLGLKSTESVIIRTFLAVKIHIRKEEEGLRIMLYEKNKANLYSHLPLLRALCVWISTVSITFFDFQIVKANSKYDHCTRPV